MMRTQKAATWFKEVYGAIAPFVEDEREARAIARNMLAHYMGYNLSKHVRGALLVADEPTQEAIATACERIRRHEPLQYILGYADFHGYRFKVNKDVLIPRPTTEQMVDHILQHCDLRAPAILDLCTGSGCIAITLSKAYPEARVAGVDISPEALTIAKMNAVNNKASVVWYLLDMLHDALPHGYWDIMVANPPYVCMEEQAAMHPRVLNYEPHKALFVPNETPLLFCKRLGALAERHLLPSGYVFVEINERFGKEIALLFGKRALENIQIWHDLQGKARWISAQKNATKSACLMKKINP